VRGSKVASGTDRSVDDLFIRGEQSGFMNDDDSPRPKSHPPGFDEKSPYEGEDLSNYPEWWCRSIEEFRQFGMRPYRPPRFADGSLVPAVIRSLEDELNVGIQLRAVDPEEADDWEVWVDGKCVGSIPHERLGEGYTRYEMTREDFRALIATAGSAERLVD